MTMEADHLAEMWDLSIRIEKGNKKIKELEKEVYELDKERVELALAFINEQEEVKQKKKKS